MFLALLFAHIATRRILPAREVKQKKPLKRVPQKSVMVFFHHDRCSSLLFLLLQLCANFSPISSLRVPFYRTAAAQRSKAFVSRYKLPESSPYYNEEEAALPDGYDPILGELSVPCVACCRLSLSGLLRRR